MANSPLWYALVPVALAAAPSPSHAAQYLSVSEAQRALFPAATLFVDRTLRFTPEQRKAIGKAAGLAPGATQPVWEVRGANGRLGWLFIDRVTGKHELITYALALDAAGTVRGLEILDYRETYGGEIRNPGWRQQFVGKRAGSVIRLGSDIRNISGATLSSRHVTDGVRRLLATYNQLLQA